MEKDCKMITMIDRGKNRMKEDNHSDLTIQIIGACFKVHQVLDPGFKEKIYYE